MFGRSNNFAAFFAAFATLVACATSVQAQVRPVVTDVGTGPKTTIYIGNSFFYYNNSLHSHVGAMNRAVDAPNKERYRSTSVTISGSGFDWHDVETYSRPNAVGRYSFDDQNNIVFNKNEKLFDLAITMDCSQCPIHPQLKPIFHDYAKRFAETVRKHGTEPVFFMSWAYADKPEMTAQLAEQYTIAGNANHALVIPVGLAFAKSVGKRPDLNLYAADKRHPSLLGTYLAASTVFAALSDKSPVGNPYVAGIESETAKFLQSVAWETVQDFYGKNASN
ncbi:MAG: hypothetical protein NVSMB26_22400 [Beijerinckiaceae bacterium]